MLRVSTQVKDVHQELKKYLVMSAFLVQLDAMRDNVTVEVSREKSGWLGEVVVGGYGEKSEIVNDMPNLYVKDKNRIPKGSR